MGVTSFGAPIVPDGSCIQPFMKVRSEECGFATTVYVVLSEQYTSMYPFFNDDPALYEVDSAMTAPDDCQRYCAANTQCAQFYYQFEAAGPRFADQTAMVRP